MWSVVRKIFKGIWTALSVFRSIVFNLIFLIVFFAVIGAISNTSTPTIIPDGAALVLAPQGLLVDSVSTPSLTDSLTNGPVAQTELGSLLYAVRQAAEDDLIQAMIIDLKNFSGSGFSKLRDIGKALEEFKSEGKKIYALGDSFTQGQYYLASFADEIILNPLGAVDIEGFSTYQTYYQDALDKLSIEVHVFRVGEYKSAVEPYIRNSMSEESRANNLIWLEDLWQLYLSDLSQQRELTSEVFETYVNTLDTQLASFGGDSAQMALETGLVDHLMTRQQMDTHLTAELGAYKDTDTYSQISHNDYLTIIQRRPSNTLNNDSQVGVIIATGTILDGEQPSGSIGGDSLATLIRQAKDDETVKALVLRIDSGGGSAFASEIIRSELLHFKSSGKPLIVSMGSVAASGGYWIAAPADEIWATPATLTGSIGIYSLIPTFDKAFERLGITVDGVGTTDLSGALNVGRPLPDIAVNAIQQTLENGYSRFLNVVSEGRNMSAEAVDAIARGQVWSGQQALEIGLVDQLGGLNEAIESAALMAGLDEDSYTPQLIQLPLSPFDEFIQGLTEGMQSKWASSLLTSQPNSLGALYQEVNGQLETVLKMNDPRGLYAHCIECQVQ